MQGNTVITVVIAVVGALLIIGWMGIQWCRHHITTRVLINRAHQRVDEDRHRARHSVEADHPLRTLSHAHHQSRRPSYTRDGWVRQQQQYVLEESPNHLVFGYKHRKPSSHRRVPAVTTTTSGTFETESTSRKRESTASGHGWSDKPSRKKKSHPSSRAANRKSSRRKRKERYRKQQQSEWGQSPKASRHSQHESGKASHAHSDDWGRDDHNDQGEWGGSHHHASSKHHSPASSRAHRSDSVDWAN